MDFFLHEGTTCNIKNPHPPATVFCSNVHILFYRYTSALSHPCLSVTPENNSLFQDISFVLKSSSNSYLTQINPFHVPFPQRRLSTSYRLHVPTFIHSSRVSRGSLILQSYRLRLLDTISYDLSFHRPLVLHSVTSRDSWSNS